MSIFTKLGVNVAAPFNADGAPRQISPQDFQIWMTEVERLIKGLLAGVGGVELPELIYKYVITGGDANKIIAKPNAEVTAGIGEALFTIDIVQPNTGNVRINNKPLLTSSGNQIVAGGLVPGIWLFLDDGANFRLVSDQASQAIMGAAERAALAAEDARDIAVEAANTAVSQGNVPIYSTLASINSLEIPAGITAIRVNGRNSVGDGEGGLYIATNNGSGDTGTSSDGRTWWKVKDVGRDRISAAAKSVIKNPYEFGAVGDGIADDGPSLRAMFARVGDIYIPDGNFRVQDDYIRLYSDTNVTMSPKARIVNDITDPAWQKSCLFVNGEQGTSNNQGGYDNTKNIHFSGGVIDGAGRADRGLMCALFNIAHHENISFNNTAVLNYAGNTHAVEINSTDTFLFSNVNFDGYKPNGATVGTREAVNIDWSSPGGFPEFGPWDGTICRNGLFENCRFKDVDIAVGCHSKPDSILNQNITIRDCLVINPLSLGFDVRFFDPSNCQFENNKFYLGVENTYDYRLEGSAFIDGRYLVVLAKDTVVTIPVNRMSYNANGPVNKQGLVFIGGHSSAASSPRGLIWGHFAQAPAINPFAIASGADQVTYTTGEITGTTGSPGSVTVSASIGKLMIASRREGTFRLDVKFMAS